MQVISSAPGRICLFGEHQDYLGLPVIAMAVDLRFYIEYEPASGSNYRILFLVLFDDKKLESILFVHNPRSGAFTTADFKKI